MCYEWMSLLDELNVTTVTDTVDNINNDDNNNVKNKMCLSCLTGNDSCSCSFCLFKMKSLDELDVLMRDLEKERSERTLIEEAEMKRNWRYLLQKQSANALRRAEYERDDEIDLNAYLNEIEMNVDYSQYDCVYQYWFNNFDKCDQQLNMEMSQNLTIVEDQLLKFRNNRQAFNLRNYHMWLEEQQRFKSQSQINSKQSNSSMSIFANVKLDSIQEFVPLNVDNNNNTNLDECVINSLDYRNKHEQKCEFEVEDVEEDTTTCHHSEDDNEEYVLDEVEIIEDEHAMMIMMCEQDEQTDQEYINYYYNDDLIENNHETTLKYFEMDTTLIESSVDATKSNDEFISNTPNNKMHDKYHIPFNNDDDQIFIDSLSEEEALNLLRSESELFALQMAQASKYGLLKNSNKSDLKNKGKKKGPIQRQPQLLEQEQKKSQIEDDTFSKSDDIFENVFNYDNQIADDNNNSQDNNYKYENFSPSIGILSNKKNISLSLRNSLLKLIHSRKHLANLIESKGFNGKIINTNSSSTSSSPLSVTASSSSTSTSTSTTSSLTSSFNINLYKHHINGQPIVSSSASSRKPCVYMLNEGRCMRADCRFVHDLKTIMCKYWLEGECLKGENCEFLHDYINEDDYPTSGSSISSTVSSTSKKFNPKSKRRDANSTSANTIIMPNKKDFKLDSEEFPALGIASSFTPSSTCGTTSTSSVTSTTNTTTLASLIKTTVNKNHKSSQTNTKSKNKTSSAIVTQSPTKQALQVTTVSIAPTSEIISKKTFLHTLTDSVITTPSTSSIISTKSTTSSTNKTIVKQNIALAAKPTVKQNQFSKSLNFKTSISNQIKAKIK